LRAVQSHPVALEQCEHFFREHPQIDRTVAADTAGSVRSVIELGDPTVAAIAGEHAARVYGGTVLQRNLEDFPENFTRFALLSSATPTGTGDKWSLVVKLQHRPGGLIEALTPFARHNINLLNLVCRPIKGRPWEYLFFIDLSASGAEADMPLAMKEVEDAVEELRVLGTYASARSGE
jgi:prephenate dehydratase